MTSDTKYDTESYFQYVKMDSAPRHMLVEGRSDRDAFTILFEYLLHEVDHNSICIDTAEMIRFPGVGNRQIVEDVCSMATERGYADRLAGFADRQFREFTLEPELHDDVSGHHVVGRIVWSRGHSIENYFIDVNVLRDPMMQSCPTGFHDVSTEYQAVFDSIICVACAVGLAAKDMGRLQRVESTIQDSIVTIENHNVEVDFDAWGGLLRHRNLSAEEIERLFERYNHWITLVRRSDINVVRWLCHGHIIFNLIWIVYEKCLASENHQMAPAPAIPLRLSMCAGAWAKRAASGQCEYPAEILELLGSMEVLEDS